MIEQIIQSLLIYINGGRTNFTCLVSDCEKCDLFIIGLIGFLAFTEVMSFTSFLRNDTSMWKIYPPMSSTALPLSILGLMCYLYSDLWSK